MRLFNTFLFAAASLAVPVAAAGPVAVPHFRSIELHGGGEVVLRHGATQSVTLLSGSSQYTKVEVRNDRGDSQRLVIDACNSRCPSPYKLRIEIVSPEVPAVAIKGGGSITAQGGFPEQNSLGIAVDGGGSIDLRSIPARSVGAAVHGGGMIRTHAISNLGAAVSGGGSIVYSGNPKVGTSISGGGSVTRARN